MQPCTGSATHRAPENRFPTRQGAGGLAWHIGREALGVLRDLAQLFDPMSLLFENRTLGQRTVSVPASDDSRKQDHDISRDMFLRVVEPPALPISTLAAGALKPGGNKFPMTDGLQLPLPTKGGNAQLAALMLAPGGRQRIPTDVDLRWVTTQLNSNAWAGAADSLPKGNAAGRMVALAIDSQVRAAGVVKDGKGGSAQAWNQIGLAASLFQRVAAAGMAYQSYPEFAAVAALGTTYDLGGWVQDSIHMTPHATVVTDGVGGRDSLNVMKVRTAQLATGAYMAALIETVAREQRKPTLFMRDHWEIMLKMMDQAVRSAVFACAPPGEKLDRFHSAKAAFTAVARFHDGVVVVAVGKCTAQIFQRGPGGSLQRVPFGPPAGKPGADDEAGLGDGHLSHKECRLWYCEQPHSIKRVIVHTAGACEGHEALGSRARETVLEEIVTPLTKAHRDAHKDLKSGAPVRSAQDDVAIVIRDFADDVVPKEFARPNTPAHT